MGKLHIAGISERINMADEQLEETILELLKKGDEGKSTALSGSTDSGSVVVRVTPSASFMAEFDDPEFAKLFGPGEDAE